MHTVPDTQFQDEAPTKPAAFVPEPTLVFARRVARLAENAIVRLEVASADAAVTAALGDLLAIRDLAGQVAR